MFHWNQFCSLGMSIKILCEKWPDTEIVFLRKCRDSLELMLESKSENERLESETASRCLLLISYEIFLLLDFHKKLKYDEITDFFNYLYFWKFVFPLK